MGSTAGSDAGGSHVPHRWPVVSRAAERAQALLEEPALRFAVEPRIIGDRTQQQVESFRHGLLEVQQYLWHAPHLAAAAEQFTERLFADPRTLEAG